MRNISIRVIIVICILSFVTDAYIEGALRGIEPVRIRDKMGEQVGLYKKSYALVIGIDNYTNGWSRLRNANKDADEIAEELEKQGFEVTLRKDLTGSAMRKELRHFFVIKGQNPEARLLLWFSGHGHTLDGEGFLVPADAPVPTSKEFKVIALHMRDFGSLVRLAVAKHVISIFDSCFAGTIFDARSGMLSPAITRATARPVRQFLTSGDADQQVSDDGSFRELFLRAIRGEEWADANKDGYLTGSELGSYLSDRVTNLTHAAQVPRYGKLLDVKYDRGDFVFVLKGGSNALPPIHEPKPEGAIQSGIVVQKQPESDIPSAIILRTSSDVLDKAKVASMLDEYNLYDRNLNINGNFQNNYELKQIKGDTVVIDHATDLMWCQSGSEKYMKWKAAVKWIKKLNHKRKGFAGFHDWRLPTLEEAVSLMESSRKKSGLYLDSPFDNEQWWIWTCDKHSSGGAWGIDFYNGYVTWYEKSFNRPYVRPVRSGPQ